jgi:hypothetical protein
MNVSGAAALVLAVGLAGFVARDGVATGDSTGRPALDRAVWSETAWPFLRDQWGGGRALRCLGAPCDEGSRLYLRAKVGFCDCFNHVEDDDDIDRLTDFDLIGGDRVVPLGPGRRLALAAGPARLRAFRLESRRGEVRHAIAAVMAIDCQARVAMLVSERHSTPALEATMLDLLDNERGAVRDASAAVANPLDAPQ